MGKLVVALGYSARPGPSCPHLTSVLHNLEVSRHMGTEKTRGVTKADIHRSWQGSRREGKDLECGSINGVSHGELILQEGSQVRDVEREGREERERE